jgi:hypothetical protein
MKFNETLIDILMLELEINAVPALMGEPGIGKSSCIEDLAKRMDTKAFTLACNQLADKADLTGGRLVPTKDGKSYTQVFYPHQVITDAIAYAEANPREYPILFLDEINRSTSDVTSAALSLPTLRSIGSTKLPQNLRIVVAGNDKGNVTLLDEASLSRFSIFHVEPDAQTLLGILGANVNQYVAAVLTKNPNLVFEKGAPTTLLIDGRDDDDDDDTNTATMADLLDGGEEMLQLTTPRTIDSISRWLNAVDQAKLLEYFQTPAVNGDRDTTLLAEIIEGHVGNTTFAKQLVAEIAVGITAGTAQAVKALSASKPQCYSSLKQAQSISDLDDLIADLTDHEKSGSLVYALFERDDNTILIQQLAQQTTSLEGDHNAKLVELGAQSALDEANVKVLLGTGTGVGNSTKVLMDMVMS